MDAVCDDCGLTKPVAEFTAVGKRKRCGLCHSTYLALRREAKAQGKKLCAICRQAKSLDEFSRTTPRYLSHRCKTCAANEQDARRRSRGVEERRRRFTIGTGDKQVCAHCRIEQPTFNFRPDDSYTNGFETICRKCRAVKQRARQRTLDGQFTNARGLAKRRGLTFTLTHAQYAGLRTQFCHYCGFPLPQTSMGLDRKDSHRGYELDNVVPCCGECNLVKGSSFSYEEMLLLGLTVKRIKAERQRKGEPMHSFERGWGRPRKYTDDR